MVAWPRRRPERHLARPRRQPEHHLARPRRRPECRLAQARRRRSTLPRFVPVQCCIYCFPYLHSAPVRRQRGSSGAAPQRRCPSARRLWHGRDSARLWRGSSGASSLSCGSCLASESVCVRASAEPILLGVGVKKLSKRVWVSLWGFFLVFTIDAVLWWRQWFFVADYIYIYGFEFAVSPFALGFFASFVLLRSFPRYFVLCLYASVFMRILGFPVSLC